MRERVRSWKSTASTRPTSASMSFGSRVCARKTFGTYPSCSRKAAKGRKEAPKSISRGWPMYPYSLARTLPDLALQILHLFPRQPVTRYQKAYRRMFRMATASEEGEAKAQPVAAFEEEALPHMDDL